MGGTSWARSAPALDTQRSFVARIVDSARARPIVGRCDTARASWLFGRHVVWMAGDHACCVLRDHRGWAEAFALFGPACVALLVIANRLSSGSRRGGRWADSRSAVLSENDASRRRRSSSYIG